MSRKAELWLYCTSLVAMLAILIVVWVVKSSVESKVYNRLTGAHTTTWDAMFVELRVQASPVEPQR